MQTEMAMSSNSTHGFDVFWAKYPVHKDRKRAEQAWNRLTATDRQAAIAALPDYIADCQQNGIQYKYAQGWLNGRRWEDERELPCCKRVVSDEHKGDKTTPETNGIETW